MSGARLHTLLPELATRQPVMVVGAAVIDVIADAYALPWRGCDIELKQQSVNVGGCALNIAVALKRLGIEAGNALPLGQGVWGIVSGMAGRAARRDAIYRFWPTCWRYPGCITGADHGLSTFSVTQSSRG